MRSRLMVLLLVAAAPLGSTVAARAQTNYPPTPASCTVNNGVAVPIGGSVALSCIALLASTTYQISFSQSPPVSLGSAATDAAGSLNATVQIPSTAHAGASTITLQAGTDVHSFAITVAGAAAGGGIGLPKTGAQIMRMVIWAVLLILLGFLLVSYARKRRRKATAGASV